MSSFKLSAKRGHVSGVCVNRFTAFDVTDPIWPCNNHAHAALPLMGSIDPSDTTVSLGVFRKAASLSITAGFCVGGLCVIVVPYRHCRHKSVPLEVCGHRLSLRRYNHNCLLAKEVISRGVFRVLPNYSSVHCSIAPTFPGFQIINSLSEVHLPSCTIYRLLDMTFLLEPIS